MDSRPPVAIVGAGSLGTALGAAISRSGWPVAAVSSRDPGRRERFQSLVPGVRAFPDAAQVLPFAELVILAVPDDAIAPVARGLRLRAGQGLIHTSGLLGAEVLEPARVPGSSLASLHPMVAFTSDVERSVAAIEGATIALEGDEPLLAVLGELAESIGGLPLRLAPGSKPAYHAAAVMSAAGVVALLDSVAAVAELAGMDEEQTLQVYGRLAAQTVANARAMGLARALTGPVSRGDAGTIEAHIALLQALDPEILKVYVGLAERQLKIAQERGSLSPQAVARVRTELAKPA